MGQQRRLSGTALFHPVDVTSPHWNTGPRFLSLFSTGLSGLLLLHLGRGQWIAGRDVPLPAELGTAGLETSIASWPPVASMISAAMEFGKSRIHESA
jgi:hypothetical protein